MAAFFHRQERGNRAPARRPECFGFRKADRLIGRPVNDEPRNRYSAGGCFDIERLCVVDDVLENVGVERENLSGTRILYADVALGAPGNLLLGGPAIHSRDRGPSNQGTNASIAGSLKHRYTTSARVANQADAGRLRDTELAAHERIDDTSKVLELRREGVATKTLGQAELTGIVHAASAEVEADRGEASLRQSIG
jgi:hypothetical protein